MTALRAPGRFDSFVAPLLTPTEPNRWPVTLSTAGHVDHGKTALVRALTGVDTDRLPEERVRGLTIELGFAPMTISDQPVCSMIDVPGHERFIRTMIAGASGVDGFLLVVAADDGVMPQTREHLRLLTLLGVTRGVVAVSKSDICAPDLVEIGLNVPSSLPVVACSSRTGEGLDALRAELYRLCAALREQGAKARSASTALYVDRVFSVAGRGTVVTGTLVGGELRQGDPLQAYPGEGSLRVRELQVHGTPTLSAAAGLRVAVNLAGSGRAGIKRGTLLAPPGARAASTTVSVLLNEEPGGSLTPHVDLRLHAGTASAIARIANYNGAEARLTLREPLFLAAGERFVLRALTPASTVGGGTVKTVGDAHRASAPPSPRRPAAAAAPAGATALEQQIRDAGLQFVNESAAERAVLSYLRSTGRVVRVSGRLYGHRAIVDDAVARICTGAEQSDGLISLGEARELLGTGRKGAVAILEHMDSLRLTQRQPDGTRELRSRVVE